MILPLLNQILLLVDLVELCSRRWRIREARERLLATTSQGKKKTGPWICGEEDCGKVCVSESKLTKHMEAHSDVFPIACPTRSATHYCTKRYKSKQARDSHLTRNECNLFMDPIEVPQTHDTLEDVVNDFEAAVGDVQPPAVTPAALPPAE